MDSWPEHQGRNQATDLEGRGTARYRPQSDTGVHPGPVCKMAPTSQMIGEPEHPSHLIQCGCCIEQGSPGNWGDQETDTHSADRVAGQWSAGSCLRYAQAGNSTSRGQ